MLPIYSLPTTQRPRERLLTSGPAALRLEELIALVIGSGSSQVDVCTLSEQISRKLLAGEGSLNELKQLPALGEAKAAKIIAALQLPSALLQRQARVLLEGPEQIFAACEDIKDLAQEHLVVFYLTSRNQQIARSIVTIGTANASLVHPREVFRPAIEHNAAHIILAHNHPSGDPTPSQADFEVTRMIARAGLTLSIELVDHLICAKDGFSSLKLAAPDLFC